MEIDLEVGAASHVTSASPASAASLSSLATRSPAELTKPGRSRQFVRSRTQLPEPTVEDVMAAHCSELANSLAEAHKSASRPAKGHEQADFETNACVSTEQSAEGGTIFVTFHQTIESKEYKLNLEDEALARQAVTEALRGKRISFAADVESQCQTIFDDDDDDDENVSAETRIGSIQRTRTRGSRNVTTARNSEESAKSDTWRARASSVKRYSLRSVEAVAHAARRISSATVGKLGRHVMNQATSSVYPSLSKVSVARDAKRRSSAISSAARVSILSGTVIGSQSLRPTRRATAHSNASLAKDKREHMTDAAHLDANRARVNFTPMKTQNGGVTDVISMCVTPKNSECNTWDEEISTASVALLRRNTGASGRDTVLSSSSRKSRSRPPVRPRSTVASVLLPGEQWDGADAMTAMRVKPNYPVFENHGKRAWPVVGILSAVLYIGMYIYLETDGLGAQYKKQMNELLRLQFYKNVCTDVRHQVWRYLSYQLLHLNGMHIGINICLLMLLGIPLERSNGHWYFFIVFQMGVVFAAGAVGVVFPTRLVIGASGGVYALFGAHLSEVVLNWNTMVTRWCRLLAFSTLIIIEFVSNVVVEGNMEKVALEAHVGGLLIGFLIGTWKSTNLVESKKDVYLKVGSNVLFWATAIFMIVYIAVAQSPPACPTGS